ncbi:MAG: branched-chain amino acid ABC transporter permease [Cyanothece sp. SIO1E1]|nr:branched-chain amino acid ABC transporter permease [Cyanothece sp. SIO1E1]
MEGYIVSLIIFTAIFALFGLGLNLQWGFTGLINFGHVAFMTVGAYTTVVLSAKGVPLVIATLAGMGIAAILGGLIGLSTLRLREDYLAIVTIGVSEMIRLVALNEEWLTRGAFGVQRYPLPLADFRPTIFSRIVMIGLLTLVVGLGLWQLWQWIGRQLRSASASSVMISALAIASYGGSWVLLIMGIAIGTRQLRLTNVVSPTISGFLLLAGVVLIIWLYSWLARRFFQQIPDWSVGLSLVSVILVSGLGLWFYGLAASALYYYSRNPTKTGLMLVCVLTLAILFWRLQALVRSPWGRVLKAIREDEEVAKALAQR